MRPLDVAKAAGLGAVIFIIDVLIAFGAMYAWGMIFQPGHSEAFYEQAAVPMARWSTRTVGTAMILGVTWFCGRRKPQRNAYAFGALIVFFYAFFDGAIVLFAGFFTLGIAVTMLLKLIGAAAGAYLARR
ncbi:MAG TPA: hypothetical protein VNZ02_09550 [Steroidobacteraceae bacterium]|jgi:hypothetical protein|nr:hypothetical protein [Steroidobacteraceae bacterium]